METNFVFFKGDYVRTVNGSSGRVILIRGSQVLLFNAIKGNFVVNRSDIVAKIG